MKFNVGDKKVKRQEYLKKWRQEHGMDYYNAHKEEILKKQKEKRGATRQYNKVNLKEMSDEERRLYYYNKVKESRLRRKES